MLKKAVTITWLLAQFTYIQNLATGQLDYHLPLLLHSHMHHEC